MPSAEPSPVPSTEPSPVPSIEPSPVPEQDQDGLDKDVSLLNDEEDEQEPLVTETFLEAAERYYGAGGSVTVGTLEASWDSASEGGTVKAGQQLNLMLSWVLNPAATYEYTTQAEPLFDVYEYTSIQITLPDGVSILEGIEGTLNNVVLIQQSGNTWTLMLSPNLDARSGSSGTMTVPLKIEGNGVRSAGEVLDFSTGALDASLYTQFTIMDRTGGTDVSSGKSYQKVIDSTGDLGTKTTVTDDVWGISKKAISYEPSSDKTTVTVTFELEVGLVDDRGTIINNRGEYERVGRVPFVDGSVTLTEIPAVDDRDDQPISAKSITVTPQFGTETPIEVPGTGTFQLPVDTCAGKQGLDDVSGSAPYLSTYTVEVVYDYDDYFIANYYDQNQDKLDVNNTATLNYQLKGQQPGNDQATASISVGEVTQPAVINISKYIVEYNSSTSKLYSAANYGGADEPISGDATFQIFKEDGTEPATIYIKQSDGTYDVQVGNTVTINPKGTGATNSTTGSLVVYLDPGTYVVKETGFPANTEKISGGKNNADDKTVTVAAGETRDAQFYDRELLGSITVTKTGQDVGATSNLAGATIGLFEKDSTEVARAISDSNGHVSFTRLPYGEYYVQEIEAPDGWLKDDTMHEVTLGSDAGSASVTVVNKTNKALVELQKYMFNGKEYVPVGSANYGEFTGAFSLEKKTDEGWVAVSGYESLSLGQEGKYNTTLPVYDADGKAITYRFKEVLPEGWHKPNDAGAKEMYSDEFTLVDQLGQGTTQAKVVRMDNDRNGSISLTKEFYALNAAGAMTQETAKEATFTLYRMVDGAGQATKVKSETFTGTVSFTDLERTDGSGNAYLYYLVEEPLEGYEADTTDTVKLNIGTGADVDAWGPFEFDDGGNVATLSHSLTVKNYSQKIPVTVKKVDSVTNQFVSGASFEIYLYDDDSQAATGNAVIESRDITSAAGVTVYLEPGHKYIVEESAVPAGYTHVTAKKDLIIDLTDISSVGSGATHTFTVTLQNRPDPQLLITKQLVDDQGNITTLTGVEFQIYTKKGESFEAVKDGYATATLTSGTAKQLPAGTYYLKEIIPENNPNGILSPVRFNSQYIGKGELKEGSFYFGSFALNEATDGNAQSLTQNFTVVNYSQLGSVEVEKVYLGYDGLEHELPGVGLTIYTKNTEGNPINEKEVTVGKDGTALFLDLPIYDETGDKITYYIKETSPLDDYTGSDAELSVTLEVGKTVTKDTDGKELKFVNLPKVDFQVTKVFRHLWEFQFTNKDYYLLGAQIALYEQQADGSYKFLKMKATDELGNVTFEDLDQDKEYVAVEYSIPNHEDYKYLEPIDGTAYLVTAAENGNPPQTLTAEQLKLYYHVTKEAIAENGTPVALDKDTLTNVEHWTQLNIEKFMMVDDDKDPDTPDVRKNVNNAKFDLYMYVVPEGDGTALTYVEGSQDYTYIGSYSSGTMYDADGSRKDGWFATNILKAGDDVVYWLVEREPGIGAQIKPENQIILIKPVNSNYSNSSRSLATPVTSCTGTINYKLDAVTTGEVENELVPGEGSTMYSTVRITKWAGAYDNDGNPKDTYTPLGNASFELWLVHEDGTKVALLDTLTTGLDNDLGQGGTEPGVLTAWASSMAFSFNSLKNEYEDDNSPGNDKDIIWTDASGNGYVRVLLEEVSTPGGYNTPTGGCQMIMYFRFEANTTTETFNDAYYVKDEDPKVPLAENQTDWALYPADESGTLIQGFDGVNGKYRIVNWPTDHFSVTVTKYGYTVNGDTMNKTSSQLDEYFQTNTGRTPIGVTMKLQRYSPTTNSWSDYTYPGSTSGATFQTDTTTGYFAFPNGLTVGRYRIIETVANSGYENIYDGSALTGDNFYSAKAYYFTVTNSNLNLNLYNPDKLSIRLLKQDTDGKTLSGAGFRLTGAATLDSTVSGMDGVVTIDNIGSGVYVLSEVTAPDGYSNAYLKEYLASAYADGHSYGSYSLKDFATGGKGIWLGFVTEQHGNDVVVTDVVDLSDYGVNDLQLKIKNPALSSIKIIKTDNLTDVPLDGAVFQVEYKAFTSWDEQNTITDDGKWTLIGKDYTTAGGAGASVTVSGLKPGIYKITEITPPAGYDLTGGPQYVVLTGGMDKTVNITGQQVITDPGDAGVTFANPQQVSLTVEKKIISGDLTVGEEHEITFNLYEEKDDADPWKTINITVTEGAENGDVFTETFTGLSQGHTYYLEETADEDFALTKVTKGTDEINPAADTGEKTLYPVTVPAGSADNITVTAENTYLYAQVTILKVDGSNGKPLDGADFEAYRLIQVPGSQDWTEFTTFYDWTALGKGEYTIRLALTGEGGNRFRIRETMAPSGYVLERPETDITLTPGQHLRHGTYDAGTMSGGTREQNNAAMLGELIFPNYQGTVITVKKYDNMEESSDAKALSGAGFTLFVKNEKNEWANVSTLATGNDGTASFTVESGKVYALVESQVPDGFQGLQGIYDAGSGQAMTSETLNGRTYYILNGGQAVTTGLELQYNAYNIPWLELEIRKLDAADSSKTPAPTAKVNVYEVPDTTGDVLTMDQVKALMDGNAPILTNVDVSRAGAAGGENYSYANSSTMGALGNTIVGGKTYLVVETESSYSQVRDNNNVVWYSVLRVPAGAQGKQIVTLKNLDASASHSLSKTTTTASYPSLMTQAAELEYTITPNVNNSYPLDNFILTDKGLSAKSGDTALDFDTYLKDKYSITQVIVGKATHDTSAYSGSADDKVRATVTFHGFDDAPIYTETVDVSSAAQTVELNSATKAKFVTVSYRSEEFEEASGYSLGQNFQPGAVKIKIQLDKQEGGSAVRAISQVTNTAETKMSWRPWSKDGVQQGGKTEIKTATAINNFGELDTALVSVSKAADTQSVDLDGGVVTYTITVSNAGDATAAMQNPFFVDLLPQGTILHGEDGNLQIIDAPEGMTIENKRSSTFGGETAFFVFLNGELKPGESVTVQLEVEATKSAALYGADIWNNVIVGSRVQGVQSSDNPRATSWKTSDGRWPNGVDNALASSVATERKDALKAMLDDMSGFGYISSSASVTWSASADASLVKTGRGDRTKNQGFSSTRLSAVNNEGYMDYQLIFSNVSKSSHFTNATLLDVLPFVGDRTSSGADRYSKWGMEFDNVTSVYRMDAGGTTTQITDYRLFCYTEAIDSSNISAVYAQAEDLKYDTVSLPSGWSESASPAATAIAVAINQDETIALDPGESYVVQFHMNVDYLDEEELAARSWTNTVNNFNCHYYSYAADISTAAPASLLSSNSVSATILPKPVKVGGHVWIDKDADGVWDADESVSDASLSGRSIVKNLLDVIEVRLNTFEGTSSSASGTTSYNKSADQDWYTDANFIFEQLDPASPNENITDAQLYSGNAPVNLLDPSQLKGSAPKTYNIAVTIPEGAGVLTQVTGFGPTSGYSRYPTDLAAVGAYANEATDNNYVKASERSSVSERFFLHATAYEVFDNTKDIGLVLERNLVINKSAADNGVPVEGAEFQVYGPFADVAQATTATLDASNLLNTVKTGSDGVADFGNLNWFQVYVIVESSAAPGYKLDGAKGTNTDGVLSVYEGTSTTNPAWVLDVPGSTVTNSRQVVNITNKRDIQYTIQASKELSGKTLAAEQFEFQLLNENMQQIETKKNNAAGEVSFTPISAISVGDFTYYIREIVPAQPAQGYTYDESLYKVEVSVTWDDQADNLKADVSYFIQEADGSWTAAPDGAKFVNEYEATPTVYAPKVEKTFAAGSQEPAAGDSFQFELAFATGDKDSVVMPADTTVTVTGRGTASFGEISFKKAGTYTFTIKETVDQTLQGFGYTFDTAEWTLTVVVIDTDGVLSVDSHNYTAAGKQDSTEQASFENSYTAVELPYVPMVEKKITGEAPLTDETFSFSLALASANPAGGAVLPANTTVSVIGAGTASFDAITFRAAGTYSFTITEVKGNAQGYTYDDSVWTLTVKTKLDNGQLVLDGDPVYKQDGLLGASNTTGAVFENEFHNFVEFTPAVYKSFAANSDPRPSAVTFSFTLKPNDNYSGVEMPGLTGIFGSTATVTGQGKGYFDAIKFTQAGTYLFTITEVNGRASGYTYDTSKWTLSVTITEDVNGQLTVGAVSYSKQGTTTVLPDYASFVNSFDKEKGPKTGDDSNLPGYTAAMLASAGALAVLEFIRRKLRKS